MEVPLKGLVAVFQARKGILFFTSVGQPYPTPESRPCQHEVLIEIYRKGQIAEALRAFKKIYLEMVDHVVDHLEAQESAESVDWRAL